VVVATTTMIMKVMVWYKW